MSNSALEKTTYVYLDESGDLGFEQGSTRYFTITFVIMEDPVPYRSRSHRKALLSVKSPNLSPVCHCLPSKPPR